MKLAVRIGIGLVALIAVFMAVTAVWIGFAGWSATPLGDQWDHLSPEQLSGHLFAPHNEHRIILSRITFWADILLAGDKGLIPTFFVYVFNFAHWALFILLARWTWPDSHRLRLLAAGAASLIFFASGFQFENFSNGFQNQFTGVFFFGTAAIFALAASVGREQRNRLMLIALSVVCSVASVGCMANGLFLVALMPFLALALGMYVTAGGYAILAALLWVLYFTGLSKADSGGLLSHLLADPVQVFADLLAYLGGAIPNSISLSPDMLPHKLLTARIFGAVALAGCIAVVMIAVLRRRSVTTLEPSKAAWAAILLFLVASGLATALGRGGGWDLAMLSNRYGAATACVWGALSFWAFMPQRSWNLAPALICAIAAGLVLAPAQRNWINGAEAFRFAKKDTEAALIAGADARDIYKLNYPDPSRAPTVGKSLREHSLAMFAEPWSRLQGTSLASRSDKACDGAIDAVSPLASASDPTWRVTMTGRPPGGTHALAAVNGEGKVVGLLIRGMTGDDANSTFGWWRNVPKWSGFVRPGQVTGKQTLDVFAVNARGVATCKLSAAIELDELSLAKPVLLSEVGLPLAGEITATVEGVFPENGLHESKRQPFAARAWGSFAGADANKGSLILRKPLNGQTRFAIPLVTGPQPKGTRVEVAVDGRIVARLDGPAGYETWGAFEVTAPAGASALEVRVMDDTAEWGGWIGVGEPLQLCAGACAPTCPAARDVAALRRDVHGGMIDVVRKEGDGLKIQGWAADTAGKRAAQLVVGVMGASTVVCAKPDLPRDDIVKARGSDAFKLSGFTMTLPTKSVDGVEILALQQDGTLAPLGALKEAAAASGN